MQERWYALLVVIIIFLNVYKTAATQTNNNKNGTIRKNMNGKEELELMRKEITSRNGIPDKEKTLLNYVYKTAATQTNNSKNGSIRKNINGKEELNSIRKEITSRNGIPDKQKTLLDLLPMLDKLSNSSKDLELILNNTELKRMGVDRRNMPWERHSTADKYHGEMAKYDAVTSETYVALSFEEANREYYRLYRQWDSMQYRLWAEAKVRPWWLTWSYKLRAYQEGENTRIQACYHIGTTFLNALVDLEDYYKMRYLYANTLEFDMGYLIQDILRKYTIALELFHMAQRRFGNESERNEIAPTAWMFYVYNVLLEQCHDVIHLCNSLSQLERKYTKPPITPFLGITIPKKRRRKGKKKPLKPVSEDSVGNDLEYYDSYSEEREKEPDDHLDWYLYKRKQLDLRYHKQIQQQFIRDHIWQSTTRTRRPSSYNDFPHHYGWSIEDW